MFTPDGYSIHAYGRMVNERARTNAYAEALRRSVHPDSVVLDIGTGAGIFAFLACQYGAAKVYAIEPDNSMEIAKKCALDIPGSERITWIRGLSTELDLPEKVDVVIGDLHGMFPFYNSNIDSFRDARQRHLKPGGRLIPARDVLRMVPAQSWEYGSVTSPWRSNEYGLNLEAGLPYVTNNMWRAKPEPVPVENLLAEPATWGVIDYMHVESAKLDGRTQSTITRAGTMHGLYIWFDGDMGDGIGFSNAPDKKELIYGRAFLPLERPVDVNPGDTLSARISVVRIGAEFIFRWNTHIENGHGEVLGDFRQSTFNARPIFPGELARTAGDFTPRLGWQGEVDRAILDAMSGNRALNSIAEEIHRRFPSRFRDHQAAFERVAKLSNKYSDDAWTGPPGRS